jgi:hypothetical protein
VLSKILGNSETWDVESCEDAIKRRIYTGIETDFALDVFVFSTYCISSDCGVLQPMTFITNDKIKMNLRDVVIVTNKHFI